MFSVEQLMIPVWDTEVIYDEALTMVRSNGACEAPLLFMPLEIIKVTSADKTEEYEEGIDYEVEGNIFRLTEGSRIFAYEETDLVYEQKPEDVVTYPMADGRWSILGANHDLHDNQIVVSYKKEKGSEEFTVDFCGELVPQTMAKLWNAEPLKVVVYGDSISEGGNCSGSTMTTPFLPVWGQLTVLELSRYYKTNISYVNTAKAGQDSAWGLRNAQELLVEKKADLAIIAFGMNDVAEPEEFVQNIQDMMEMAREVNPEIEFILGAPSTANPILDVPGKYKKQDAYSDALRKLTKVGIAVADFNNMQKFLMNKKRYIDITGNNVNHPNDFFSRCHAQVILRMLIEGGK